MKKTLRMLAAIAFLTAILAPATFAIDGFPNPGCGGSLCKPANP